MTKQDREIVEQIRGEGVYGNSFTVGQVHDLIDIIDRLDTQLVEIKEAGEPFVEFGKHFPQEDDDYEAAYVIYAGSEAKLTAGNFRRLAKALKEVTCD